MTKGLRESPYLPYVLQAAAALVIVLALAQFSFHYLEALFSDASWRLKPNSAISGQIELVAIDQPTISRFGHVPTARDHLRFIKALTAAHPKAVVYFTSPAGIPGEPGELKELAEAMAALPGFTVAINDTYLQAEKNARKLAEPFAQFPLEMSPISRDLHLFSRDDVTRRMLISYDGQSALELKLAQLIHPELKSEGEIRGAFEFLQSQQVYISFHPTLTYPISSFSLLAEQNQPEPAQISRFRDKIVLVGRDLNDDHADYVRTPYSRDVEAMTALEAHANMLDTIILNSAPVRADSSVTLLIAFLIGFLGLRAIFAQSPAKGLLNFLGLMIATAVISQTIFCLFGYWISLAPALITTFILFYVVIPYRLVLENRRKLKHYQARSELAAQVSHDIRSPLAALNMVLNTIDSVSDEKHLIIRNSTRRINDIANNLLQQSRTPNVRPGQRRSPETNTNLRPSTVLLSSTIEAIVSEKRAQFRDRTDIEIVSEIGAGYGLFALLNEASLLRVLSNLINNAVEACHNGGHVLVSIRRGDGVAVVEIKDDGPGIPPDLIGLLGDVQIHSRKRGQSGSGLGVLYAAQFVRALGGNIEFLKPLKIRSGTLVRLSLPLTTAPYWFAEQIEITKGATIVSVDDDETIHQLWASRLSQLGSDAPGFRHVRLSSPKMLTEFCQSRTCPSAQSLAAASECLFLIDYEFVGHRDNGLKLIEHLGIASSAVLVTSHFDEKGVQTDAEFVGVKIIPKGLASQIPIHVNKKPQDRHKHPPVLRPTLVRSKQPEDIYENA